MDGVRSSTRGQGARLAISCVAAGTVGGLGLLIGKLAGGKFKVYGPVAGVGSLLAGGTTFALLQLTKASQTPTRAQADRTHRLSMPSLAGRKEPESWSWSSSLEDKPPPSPESSKDPVETLLEEIGKGTQKGDAIVSLELEDRMRLLKQLDDGDVRQEALWALVGLDVRKSTPIGKAPTGEPITIEALTSNGLKLVDYLNRAKPTDIDLLTTRPNGQSLSVADCDQIIELFRHNRDLLEHLFQKCSDSVSKQILAQEMLVKGFLLEEMLPPLIEGRNADEIESVLVAVCGTFTDREIKNTFITACVQKLEDKERLSHLLDDNRLWSAKECIEKRLVALHKERGFDVDALPEKELNLIAARDIESLTSRVSFTDALRRCDLLSGERLERPPYYAVALVRHYVQESEELRAVFGDVLGTGKTRDLRRRIKNTLRLFRSITKSSGTGWSIPESCDSLTPQDVIAAPALLRALGDDLPEEGHAREALKLYNDGKGHEALMLGARSLIRGEIELPASELQKCEYSQFPSWLFPGDEHWATDSDKCQQAEEALQLALALSAENHKAASSALEKGLLTQEQAVKLIKKHLELTHVSSEMIAGLGKQLKADAFDEVLGLFLEHAYSIGQLYKACERAQQLHRFSEVFYQQATPGQYALLWGEGHRTDECLGWSLSAEVTLKFLNQMKLRGAEDEPTGVAEALKSLKSNRRAYALEPVALCLTAKQLDQLYAKEDAFTINLPDWIPTLARALEMGEPTEALKALKGVAEHSPVLRLLLDHPDLQRDVVDHLLTEDISYVAAAFRLLGRLLPDQESFDAVTRQIEEAVKTVPEDKDRHCRLSQAISGWDKAQLHRHRDDKVWLRNHKRQKWTRALNETL